jgi:hypothetical protein
MRNFCIYLTDWMLKCVRFFYVINLDGVVRWNWD